jgi:hypothetical protein
MAADHSGKALGHQPGGLGPGRGVVGDRVGPLVEGAFPQRLVDPEHGGQGGHHRHHHDEEDQQPEGDQPPLAVVLQQRPEAGDEGQEPEQEGSDERDGQEPELADDLAVEEPGADEAGRFAVQPLHPVEQRTGVLAGRQLGQHLADDVMAERGVHR